MDNIIFEWFVGAMMAFWRLLQLQPQPEDFIWYTGWLLTLILATIVVSKMRRHHG